MSTIAALGLAACGGGGGGAGPTHTTSAAPTTTPPAAAARTPVAVSTDMSWDDIVALVYLLRRPDVEVTAIVVNGDGLTHCAPGVTHVEQLLSYLGHAAVPVACGRTAPSSGSAEFHTAWRAAADDFFRLDLPPATRTPATQAPAAQSAVTLLDRALRSVPKTLIVSLGPMTDLADLLAVHPEVRPRIDRIVAMAGAIDVPGNEPVHARAEWNVFVDPAAAERVLRSGVPITLVPLDACDDVPVSVVFRHALDAHETPGASEVVSMLLSDPYYTSGSQFFWDPAAAMVAAEPGVARARTETIAVVQGSGPDRGRTVVSRRGAPVDVVVDVDAHTFYEGYLRVVLGDSRFVLAGPSDVLGLAYADGRWSVDGALRPVAGTVGLRLSNAGASLVGVVVGRVTGGRTLADVDRAIRGGVTSAPSWFEVVLQVIVPRGHPAVWGVDLRPGTYVVVGGGAGLPLRRLAAVRVP